jgi:hypothetical protein
LVEIIDDVNIEQDRQDKDVRRKRLARIRPKRGDMSKGGSLLGRGVIDIVKKITEPPRKTDERKKRLTA